MKFTLFVLIIFFTIISLSCGTFRYSSSLSKMKIYTESTLNGKIEYEFNTDSTMAICIGNKKKSNLYFSFFVYSLSEKRSVSNVFNHVEKVFWKDEFEVKYFRMMGTIQKGGKLPSYRTISFK